MDNSLIGSDLYVEEIGKIFATEFLLQLQENMKNG